MLRMDLFSSVVIRALMISIGYFGALYLAYKLKPSKRSFIDIILIGSLMFLMSTRIEWILLKLLSYYVLGVLLLIFNHRVNKYGALMFGLILVMMLSFSDLISVNIISQSDALMNAVKYQENNVYGILAVVIPSLVVMVVYLISGWIVRKTLDFDLPRSKVTYSLFSSFYLIVILIISLTMQHVLENIAPGIPMEDVYEFISLIYIPIILIMIYSYYYLYHIIKWEKMIRKREIDLLQTEHKRRDGYRANHNIDNIILTIDTLAKNKQFDELQAYLEKL